MDILLKKFINFYQTVHHDIPEKDKLPSCHCENLKSQNSKSFKFIFIKKLLYSHFQYTGASANLVGMYMTEKLDRF